MPAHPLSHVACALFLLVSAASPSSAQVILREKARIDPGIVRPPGPGTGGGTTEGFFSPCNPPYDDLGPPVITRRSVFPGASLSLAALTCPYCPPHHMEGQLTAGSGYVRLELNRPAGLGGEINGNWFHFREAWGYDVRAVFDQAIPEDSVLVTFTMHYVDFPPPNIEYIEVYYVRRMFTLSTRADPPAPEQGRSADLSAWVTDQCGGGHPDSYTLTARILSGGERGQLLDPRTQERGQVLAHLLPPQGYTPTVVFLADGQDADSTTEVEIEFSASLPEVPPVRVTLQVQPGPTCPVVRLDPLDPAPGDTCRITLIKKKFDGTLTEYPPGQLFSVMLYPDEAGTLFSPHRADTSEYFSAIPADGLLWLAAPQIAEESLSVYLWVNEVPAGEGRPGSDGDDGTDEADRVNVKRLAKLHDNGGIRPLGPEQDVCNAAWAVLKPRPLEILLGETKYYQARPDPTSVDRLIIDELLGPSRNGGIAEDVWGQAPVAIQSGDKLGVYWEKLPLVSQPSDSAVLGLLRLVGRHWLPSVEFAVRITAQDGIGRTGTREVIVKKPDFLGTTNGISVDVLGLECKIDSLLIQVSGRTGIPPQIIKGQVEQESAFRPAYRWEPFFDAVFVQRRTSRFRSPSFRYRVTNTTNIGSPGIPLSHTNPTPNTYWGYAGTIWDLFSSHSSTLNPATPPGANLYPSRNSRGYSLWYELPLNKYETVFHDTLVYWLFAPDSLDRLQAGTKALHAANQWLRYSYRNGVMDTSIAQTRSASSYGILQITYPTATDERNYPFEEYSDPNPGNEPERLNQTEVSLAFSVPHLRDLLDRELLERGDGPNNWFLGFDSTITISLNRYNGVTGQKKYSWHYGRAVMNKAKSYLPRRATRLP